MVKQNYRNVRTLLWAILFANFLVSIIKLSIGVMTNCKSLMADGFHSFSDGTSNVVGLIGIGFAAQPEDSKHPYGHQKFEVLASLFIGVMLILLSGKILISAYDAFMNPQKLNFSLIEMIAVGCTILINIAVSFLEYKKGVSWKSSILIADSIHTRSDILVSVGVLIGMIGMKLGLPPQIDTIISLIIAVVIFYSAYEILKPSIATLVDSAVVDNEEIATVVEEVPLVQEVHKIRSRGTASCIYIDMHVLVDPDNNVIQTHDLSHHIESKLQEIYGETTQVIIHVEPCGKSDNSQ